MAGNEVMRVGRCGNVVIRASDLGGKGKPSSRQRLHNDASGPDERTGFFRSDMFQSSLQRNHRGMD
jgi:hypothetical protein